MNLKLRCTDDFYYADYEHKGKISKSEEVYASIEDGEKGIRLQINGVYSLPYYISDIEEHFTAIQNIIEAKDCVINFLESK